MRDRVLALVKTMRLALWAAFEYLAMALGLGALAFMCLWGLPFALFFLVLPRKWRIPLGRQTIATSFSAYLGFLRCFCGVRLDSAALASLQQGPPLILVANHPSLLDAVILLSRLPRATCVMKATLSNNILFGPVARFSGYISNQDSLQLIKQACLELHNGAHLLIFPEGTRTLNFPLNPLGQTAALIAQRSGMPVQTLILEFSAPYLGKTWPLFKRPPLPLHIRVKLGQRFEASDNKELMTQTLEMYYRQQLSY